MNSDVVNVDKKPNNEITRLLYHHSYVEESPAIGATDSRSLTIAS